jgi:hypothetical protein
MTVKSTELINGKAPTSRRPSTALVSHGGAIGAMILLLRIIAVLLVLASTFGNYVQFMGGWDRYLPIGGAIAGAAILYQVICSVLQWGFKAGGMWFPYAVALLASAIPSFLTYNALFGPYLATQVGTIPALIGIGIAVLGGDALPEWVIVG